MIPVCTIVLGAFSSIIGFIFNSYIISLVLLQKRSSASNVLLLNLAFIDIIFCFLVFFWNSSLGFLSSHSSNFSSLAFSSSSTLLLSQSPSSTSSSSSSTPSSSSSASSSSSSVASSSPHSQPLLTSSTTPILTVSSETLSEISSILSLVNIQGMLYTLLPITMVYTICGLTWDKYIHISYPLHYSNLINSKKILLFIFFSWFIAIILSLPPLFGLCEYKFSSARSSNIINCPFQLSSFLYIIIYCSLAILLPLAGIIIANCRMLIIAHDHRSRISTAIYEITVKSQVISYKMKQFRKHRDALVPVSQLIGSLILFTLPNYIILIIESIDSSLISPIIISFSSILLNTTPIINAYIFGVKSKLLRSTFKRLLLRYLYKQNFSEEIERRLSLRSQTSISSVVPTMCRRNSCPLMNEVSIIDDIRRRQSLIINDTNNIASINRILLIPPNQTISTIRNKSESIVKFATIKEKLRSSESV